MLTEKSRANKNHAVIVVKIWTMMTKDIADISFSSKKFNPMIEEAEISAEEKAMLVNMFDFIVNIHDELVGNHEKDVAKKLYTETHLVSLIPYIKKSMENNISEAMVSEWLINFFKTENDIDVYTKYATASSGSVASNASIVARHEALGSSYDEFFKK